MKRRIHISQAALRANRKTGSRLPVITIKTSRGNTYAQQVQIEGPCKLIYSPDKPLSCGATVWIETTSECIALKD